jgi:F-type H+-transporting ATPase subunit a
VPIIIPTVMDVLGLLTGMIQAYIFAILAAVYIASGTEARVQREQRLGQRDEAQGTETPEPAKGDTPSGRS